MCIQRKGTLVIVRWFGDVDQERQELRLVYRLPFRKSCEVGQRSGVEP